MIPKKTVISVIHEIEKQLESVYDDPTLCRQYAWWLLEAITKKKKGSLIAQHCITLSNNEQKTIDIWLEKLTKEHMPLQYLLGSVPFNDVNILVEPPILIPRPETEEWCLNLINQLKQLKNQKLTILDLCAGSGCIALALAKALPQATIYASDISHDAFNLIHKNIKHNNIKNITVIRSDLFNKLPQELFDIIVSNPPYITINEWKHLDASVTNWEDTQALIAQDNGLAIIKKIIEQAPHFLKHNAELEDKHFSNVILEIGYRQANAVKTVMEHHGYTNITIEKDLEEKDRVVRGDITPCGCHHKKMRS